MTDTPASDIRIRLCTDCTYVDANGFDDDVDPEWTGFLKEWDGWLFGPYLEADIKDEEEAYEYQAAGHYVRPGSPCDGCGSTLGGQRWDYLAAPR